MKALLRPALTLFFALTMVTGVLYPALVTLIAQTAFPRQANGSLIQRNGQVVGSEHLGQEFSAPQYFWGRLSATAPAYNAAASSGANLGPMAPDLEERVHARMAALKQADPTNTKPVPVDLVTASGSGLDPHISVTAAEYQVARVARKRHLSEQAVHAIVKQCTQGRTLGILGEERVNVLQLNLALDGRTAH